MYTSGLTAVIKGICYTIRYDTRCYFNVRSKADMSQLNLPDGVMLCYAKITIYRKIILSLWLDRLTIVTYNVLRFLLRIS